MQHPFTKSSHLLKPQLETKTVDNVGFILRLKQENRRRFLDVLKWAKTQIESVFNAEVHQIYFLFLSDLCV